MQWFRHYVGLARDPKMVAVAAKSRQPVERVVWLWCAILEGCSEGDVPEADIDPDEVAYFLRCEPEDITAILEQMEAVGLLTDGKATAWEKRQFKTDNVTERVRKHRERKRQEGETLHVTERNVTETPPDTDSDTDTEISPPYIPPAKAGGKRVRKVDRDYTPDFEDFWAAYPRRKGKRAALAAYLKAKDRAPPEQILASAERFAAECVGTEPRFVPHPATWLNQDRWKDEPDHEHTRTINADRIDAIVNGRDPDAGHEAGRNIRPASEQQRDAGADGGIRPALAPFQRH